MILEKQKTSDNGRIDEILAAHSGIRLDIGCGGNKQETFVGLDIRPLDGVDIVHDFEDIPWPLPDESVLVAVASHVVEHINPHKFGFINFMDEVWRVLKDGAEFAIATPHGSSQGFLQDPTHCNPCNEATWAYFVPEHPSGLYNIYQPRPWRIKYLTWSPAANIEVIMVKDGS
jgi:SAM-dependent methyltransferase